MSRTVKIIVDDLSLEAVFFDTPCAQTIVAAIPIEASHLFRRKPAGDSDEASRGGGADRRRGEWGQFAVTSSSLVFFAARSFRSDSPFSSRRWALWTRRSSTASAMVGSPM